MHIAICDDEAFFRILLKEQLEIYSKKHAYDFVYSEFFSGDSLLESGKEFDLIFMDYRMDGTDGIDTVRKLRMLNNNTAVVFVSSYREVVFESLKVQPFRFLVKPLDVSEFNEAMDSFAESFYSEAYIFVPDELQKRVCRVS